MYEYTENNPSIGFWLGNIVNKCPINRGGTLTMKGGWRFDLSLTYR